tara:strand:+ start:113 stop:1066 length:954 start_codon:yes stop_codon:yes gene_type:complete
MKNIIKKLAELLFACSLIICVSFEIANADKSGVIKIPTHNWSSQLVGATIVGELMKMVGEKVEYIPMDSQKVYQSMADGDIDIVHEIWEIVFGASYERAKANGGIEEISTHDAIGRDGWWYPEYVEKVCPGMPDWKFLAECSEKFARVDSNGKGVFFGLRDIKKHNTERVEALKMNFVVKNLESPNAIWDKLDKAVNTKKPIVIFNWSPNFIGAKYKGKFVEFPKYNTKCTTDPLWGINPNALYDCENPSIGYIKIAVNADFKKNHPKGYKVIKQLNFSTKEIDKMANYVDTEKLEVIAAAQKWLEDHKEKWRKWIE